MTCFLFLVSDNTFLEQVKSEHVKISTLRKPTFSHDLHMIGMSALLLELKHSIYFVSDYSLKNIGNEDYLSQSLSTYPLYEVSLSAEKNLQICKLTSDFRNYASAMEVIIVPYANYWSNCDGLLLSAFVGMIKDGLVRLTSGSKNPPPNANCPHLTCLMAGPYYLEMPYHFSNGELYGYLQNIVNLWDSIIVCNTNQKEFLVSVVGFLFRVNIKNKIFPFFSLTPYVIRRYLEAKESQLGANSDLSIISKYTGGQSLTILFSGGFYTWTNNEDLLFGLVNYICKNNSNTRLKIIIQGILPVHSSDPETENRIISFLSRFGNMFAQGIDQISEKTRVLLLSWEYGSQVNNFLHSISDCGVDFSDPNALETFLRQRVRSAYFSAYDIPVIVNALNESISNSSGETSFIVLKPIDENEYKYDFINLENILAKARIEKLLSKERRSCYSNNPNSVLSLYDYIRSSLIKGSMSQIESCDQLYPNSMFSHQDNLRSLELKKLYSLQCSRSYLIDLISKI